MKKILVIGSNSFAGSNFIDFLLSANYKVFGVSRSNEINKIFLKYKNNKKIKNFFFNKINLNFDKDINQLIGIIKKNKIRYIVNFAAQGMVAESWITPQDWYLTNIVSNAKLINKISKLKISKYLNFSTPEVYGSTSKMVSERNNFQPNTPYAVSRAAQDFNLFAYYKNFNFPIAITRAANIYGPHQQTYRIITKSIISYLINKKIPLHGKGNSTRSFIFMDDVSKILHKILIDKDSIGQSFHISTKKFVTIKFLVNKIQNILKIKKNLIINVKERDGKDLKYLLDSSKVMKRYPEIKYTSLEKGLKDTINWVSQNLDYLKKQSLNYKHKK